MRVAPFLSDDLRHSACAYLPISPFVGVHFMPPSRHAPLSPLRENQRFFPSRLLLRPVVSAGGACGVINDVSRRFPFHRLERG